MFRPEFVALRLLGPVGLLSPSKEHSVGGAKARAVLAGLGLRLNQVVPISQLIEDVWGNHPPATARNIVQVYISGIRRALESAGNLLRLNRLANGYRLSGRPDQVDWFLFGLLTERGRASARGGDDPAAANTLAKALSLWTGPPLADLTGTPLRAMFVPAMAAARSATLSDRIEADLALGRPGLIGELTELVDAHPLDERFTRQLMQALHGEGRRADALDRYRAIRPLPAWRGQAARSPDAFVGRHTELADLSELLSGPGLVTLAGPPGVGKSRLAVEVANRMGDAEGLRPFVVRLDAASRPEDVATLVADACGPQPAAVARRPPIDRIKSFILGINTLLVLDNCEHLVSACAQLSEELMRDSDLRILATSTRPLRATGEVVYRLPPLAVPPVDAETVEEVGRADAVSLFCLRTRAIRPDFVLTNEVAPIVAEICRLIEGLPLSIELASGRTQVLSPAELFERLQDQLKMLRSVRRRPADRHDSLASALATAVGLLDADERVLFARLAVFLDSFTFQAAEALAPAELSVIDALQGLVEASLVVADVSSRETQFRMLEPVRQYGRSLLSEAEIADVLDRRTSYLGTLARAAAAGRNGPDRAQWRRRLEVMKQDLLDVLDRTLDAGRLDVALPLAADLWWWSSNAPQAGLDRYRWLLLAAGEGGSALCPTRRRRNRAVPGASGSDALCRGPSGHPTGATTTLGT